jgi:hypothetical protein
MSANRNTKRRENPESNPDVLADIKPRTELGKTLASLRAKIVASGEYMLDDDELEDEIAERRGGYYRSAKDE